jgi:hypothetical protein
MSVKVLPRPAANEKRKKEEKKQQAEQHLVSRKRSAKPFTSLDESFISFHYNQLVIIIKR